MELRGYQREVVELLKGGNENKLIQAPTGAGKTIMFCKYIQESGLKCLILAHRGELIRQARDKLALSTGLDCGVFSAYLGKKELKPVTVASIQSLARYNGELDFDVMIIDECHRVPAKLDSQYMRVISSFNGKVIGFTATPYRLDTGAIYEKGLIWSELDYQISLRQLIDEGYLSDYLHRVAIGTAKIKIEVSKLKITAGEFNDKESGELMGSPMCVNAVFNTVQDEKSIVVFCVSIAHAETMAQSCPDEYSIVHSKMSASDRDENLRAFDAGEVRWIFNVGVLTEGWDCPRVDAVVLVRPTKSTALYVQMVGRSLRIFEGKSRAVIYDIVGMHEQFGFVDNPRKVTDEAGEKGDALTKVCPECFEVVAKALKVCNCGYILVPDEEPKPEEDSVDDVKVMVDLDVNDSYDMGTISHGKAEFYTSDKGTECLKVGYYHSANGWVYHYYPVKQKWVGAKLAGIAKRFSSVKTSWLAPSRFEKAVNGGHLFPMENMRVTICEKGYAKINGL